MGHTGGAQTPASGPSTPPAAFSSSSLSPAWLLGPRSSRCRPECEVALASLVLQAVPMGTVLVLKKPSSHWLGQKVALEILDALLATMPELVATSFLQRQMLL